jgi:hypothetical protein
LGSPLYPDVIASDIAKLKLRMWHVVALKLVVLSVTRCAPTTTAGDKCYRGGRDC